MREATYLFFAVVGQVDFVLWTGKSFGPGRDHEENVVRVSEARQ